MSRISLASANQIIAAALARGRALALKPLAVVVLDSGGYLIAAQREDGAPSGRVQVATAKASGALFVGVSSRKLAEMASERPAFIASLGPMVPNGVVPAAGAVIIVDGEGQPLGAVGVSGDLSDNDELCALEGIAAAGLIAQS
jgi:uncharacterized protein GlcG (DUF336 family)